jgi:hypothetical protein
MGKIKRYASSYVHITSIKTFLWKHIKGKEYNVMSNNGNLFRESPPPPPNPANP